MQLTKRKTNLHINVLLSSYNIVEEANCLILYVKLEDFLKELRGLIFIK